MDKNRILNEIRRIAAENSGKAPGFQLFERETGIGRSSWYPRLWLRWSDALTEAGHEPNKFNERIPDDHILEQYALLVRELGHTPVIGEVRRKAITDKAFPAHTVFSRYGGKIGIIKALLEFCVQHPEYADVSEICKPSLTVSHPNATKTATDSNVTIGYVYLMKSGKHYKIGRSVSVERREREIGLIVPELRKTIHWIETDDPSGVEAYWHRRFSDRRTKGEWYSLLPEDVAAFKRWKKLV